MNLTLLKITKVSFILGPEKLLRHSRLKRLCEMNSFEYDKIKA